jgi:polyphosphate kinase 2 (PPK2 family)
MGFNEEQLLGAKTRNDLLAIAKKNNISVNKVLKKLQYEAELHELQSELVNLQKWVARNKMRVAIIFEGRDAAGKGGAIKRFKEHLNPRSSRVVALTKPTEVEKGQWYFRRYIQVLPNPGEIVFLTEAGTIAQ